MNPCITQKKPMTENNYTFLYTGQSRMNALVNPNNGRDKPSGYFCAKRLLTLRVVNSVSRIGYVHCGEVPFSIKRIILQRNHEFAF